MKFTIKFKIKKVLFTNSKTNYRIFIAKVLNHNYVGGVFMSDEMTFKGTMISCKEKDTYTAEGTAEYDLQGRRYVKIESIKLEQLEYEDEIARFIAKNVKGVTKAKADEIVKAFGVNTLEVIGGIDGHLKIKGLKIKGLGEKTALKIKEAVVLHKNFENLMVFLEANNLDVSLASKIYENLGKTYNIKNDDYSVELVNLKTNPYQLFKHIDFTTLDIIGQRYTNNPRMIDRIIAGIYSYVDNDISTNGNVYTEKSEIQANITEYMEKLGAYTGFKVDKLLLEDAFKVIIENRILRVSGNYVYKNENLYMEDRIAERIMEIKALEDDIRTSTILEELEAYEKANNLVLDELQKEAVMTTIKSRFSILTGGPGTGKTFTTNLILQMYKRLFPFKRVVLLAPTGKASKRLSELCNETAMTIHRGLKIRPEEQVHIDEDEKIEADFIIVDEASMIDLKMLYNLLMKTDSETKILFVGDYQQLPSVGAGLILRDLLDSNQIYNTKLTKVFRQALESNIIVNSHKVINGEVFTKEDFSKDCFFLQEAYNNKFHKKCIKIIQKAMENGHGIEDVVILTATNKGDLGTKMMNLIIQEQFNKSKKKYEVSSVKFFKEGDRVMHTKNNYDLEVYNGEIGTISFIGDTSLDVDFGDRVVTYMRDDIKELELAYCMTVHKSQGSEYPIVISLIPSAHEHMLHRNLIYTAWTRAKKRLYVVGELEALNKGSEKNTIINRKSRLIEKISK